MVYLHAPLQKISKYKLKFNTEPWITATFQKSFPIKNTLLKRYIRLKIPEKLY